MATMVRVPEPELMNDAEQARAYSEADFSEPHQMFVDRFVTHFPQLASASFHAIDLGCGPADVTCRFALAHRSARIVGVDAAHAMLQLGRTRVCELGLSDRVDLRHRLLPDRELGASFDAVLSNSLLHHLADPEVLWQTVAQVAARGASIFVMDLCRPIDATAVDTLVATHAAGAPDVLRRDFRASLHAAYTVDEVRAQVRRADLDLSVEQITDRHLVVWGRSSRDVAR